MRNTLLLLSLAAGLSLGFGLACASSAGAVPIGATAMKEAAAATSPLEPAQYAEYRTRRGHLVKCYREFVVGPYRCHWYPL
jgi:hypothetical protein